MGSFSQLTSVVERMFSVDSEPERQSWIEAIEAVKEVSVERFSGFFCKCSFRGWQSLLLGRLRQKVKTLFKIMNS